MVSSAFAEEGEFETARQFMQQSKNSRKKVLLGTDEEEINLTIINHALKLCQRVGAGLEILHVVQNKGKNSRKLGLSKTNASLTQAQSKLQKMGISYNQIDAEGTLANELINHVAKRRDVMLVVLDAKSQKKSVSQTKNHKTLDEIFAGLRCPLVVYGEPTKA